MASTKTPATNPKSKSSAYVAMEDYWDKVEAIVNGAPAMRAAGQKYLPKFAKERQEVYNIRLQGARFTNIYSDVVRNLASKPFSKEVRIKDTEKVSSEFKTFYENVDKSGNNLHVFSTLLFLAGINDAVTYILVDMPPVAEGTTVADAKAKGASPYWVHVLAKQVLAYYVDTVDGNEQPVHVRIYEPIVQRDGFDEKTIDRVRVFNREPIHGDEDDPTRVTGYEPATWEVFEERTSTDGKTSNWVSVEAGPISIGVIAIVPFITGTRKGKSWEFIPPMQDVAELQIDYYQSENGLKDAKIMTCYPMLSGSGVTQPTDEAGNPVPISVGPRSVLMTAPKDQGSPGEWKFIEPAATSLRFLADDLKTDENRMRELGRQPLTAQSGNLTVVTTTFAAQKGNSAVQQWALGLKDALENASKLTGKFMGASEEPEIVVYTDFSAGGDSEQATTMLTEMRKNGDISRKAITDEAKRRDILSAEFDAEKDLEQLLDEARMLGEPDADDPEEGV